MIRRYLSVTLLSKIFFLCLAAVDIFSFQIHSDALFFSFASLWILSSFILPVTYKDSLKLALFFLVLVILESLYGLIQPQIERTALWAYALFFIGTVQNIITLWKK